MNERPAARAEEPAETNSSVQHDAGSPFVGSVGAASGFSVLRLAQFAREIGSRSLTVEQVLDDVLASAVELISDASTGCVTTLQRGVRTVVASTDLVAEQMCRLQYELGEGPIDTELWHLDTVVSQDLECESRWPLFAEAAVEANVRSLAAFRLYAGDADLGALVFYSSKPDAFSADDVVVGEAVAAHAALALLSARERNQFSTGLASRDLIGRAKGMLMERYTVDALRAFELMATLSQERNLPLRTIAAMITEVDHPAASAVDRSDTTAR